MTIGSFVVAIVMVLEEENKFLIAKRANNKEIGANTWEFPSGRLETNEDPEAAIVREGQEELGCKIMPIRLFHAYKFMRLGEPCIVLHYLCKREGDIRLSNEHSEYHWVLFEELSDYFTFETQLQSLESLAQTLQIKNVH